MSPELRVPVEREGVVTDWHKDEESEHMWLHWRSTGQMFEARCGPTDLPRALTAFQDFATSAVTRMVPTGRPCQPSRRARLPRTTP